MSLVYPSQGLFCPNPEIATPPPTDPVIAIMDAIMSYIEYDGHWQETREPSIMFHRILHPGLPGFKDTVTVDYKRISPAQNSRLVVDIGLRNNDSKHWLPQNIATTGVGRDGSALFRGTHPIVNNKVALAFAMSILPKYGTAPLLSLLSQHKDS